MTTPDVRGEIRLLLSLALRRHIAADENPARDIDPAWDSLKHLEIVFLLEDHFQIRFSDAELEQLQDADRIAEVLEARVAA